MENLSLYPFTAVADFADTMSVFFLQHLIVEIQKTIFYFETKNQNY